MKKLFLVIAILLIASPVWANPFIVCDPQAGVTHYKVAGAAWVSASVPAQTDGSIKMDVANAPVGTSNLTFKACLIDAIWGEQCSASAPFTFTKPGMPNIPVGVKLAP